MDRFATGKEREKWKWVAGRVGTGRGGADEVAGCAYKKSSFLKVFLQIECP